MRKRTDIKKKMKLERSEREIRRKSERKTDAEGSK